MVNGLVDVVEVIPSKEKVFITNPVSLSSKIERPYVSESVGYSSRIEEMNERDSYSSCWDSSD